MGTTLQDLIVDLKYKPTHIVEVGVGPFNGIMFNKFLDSDARMAFFEPNPEFFKDLREGLKDYPNKTAFNLGIYKACEYKTFEEKWASTCIEGENSPLSHEKQYFPERFKDEKTNKFETLCIKFDGYDDGTIDVLALDMEGCEFYCLESLKSRPHFLSIETHYIHTRYENPYINQINAWIILNNYEIVQRTETDIFLINNNKIRIQKQ